MVDEATTTVGDDVLLYLGKEWREEEERKRTGDDMLRGFTCRICSGEHFTMHCPRPRPIPTTPTSPTTTPTSNKPSKYVPPSRRGEPVSPDKTTCLRVSCISQQLTEDEFYARFVRFGRIARTFLPRDYNSGEGKGYGYVSFVRRKDAARAMEMMDRKGFDNLIMRIAWDERNISSSSDAGRRD